MTWSAQTHEWTGEEGGRICLAVLVDVVADRGLDDVAALEAALADRMLGELPCPCVLPSLGLVEFAVGFCFWGAAVWSSHHSPYPISGYQCRDDAAQSNECDTNAEVHVSKGGPIDAPCPCFSVKGLHHSPTRFHFFPHVWHSMCAIFRPARSVNRVTSPPLTVQASLAHRPACERNMATGAKPLRREIPPHQPRRR